MSVECAGDAGTSPAESTRVTSADSARALSGRVAELAVIDEAIAGLRRTGNASLLLIEGSQGIGKTRLVREAARRATRSGVRAVAVAAGVDRPGEPFAPLVGAILTADPPIDGADALGQLVTGSHGRSPAVRALADAIASATSAEPLMFCLDDVQRVDIGVMAALRSLIALLRERPVLWVFAMRPAGGRAEVRDATASIAATFPGVVRRLVLGPLGDHEVAAMIRDVLGADADDSVLQMTDLAQGNPLLVLELLDGLAEEARLDIRGDRAVAKGGGVPRRLTSTVQAKLRRLSPSARRTVQVASVLPDRFSAVLLARTLGRRPSGIMRDVDEAIRCDLFAEVHGNMAFRHEVVRLAARQSLEPALRQAVERKSAAILLE